MYKPSKLFYGILLVFFGSLLLGYITPYLAITQELLAINYLDERAYPFLGIAILFIMCGTVIIAKLSKSEQKTTDSTQENPK